MYFAPPNVKRGYGPVSKAARVTHSSGTDFISGSFYTKTLF